MKTLTFENETHWRTSDIQRIVRLVMGKAKVDLSETRSFHIKHHARLALAQKHSEAYVSFPLVPSQELTRKITIYLPRRGAKDPHPVAMVALAANAAVAGKVGVDDELLPFSDVYYIVNTLAYQFAAETARVYEDEDGSMVQNRADLQQFFQDVSPPAWADPSKLFIAKYKDRLKDSTFKDFLKKKRTAIKTEITKIATEEQAIRDAQRRLKDARKRKKAAEKAIQTSTERRSS